MGCSRSQGVDRVGLAYADPDGRDIEIRCVRGRMFKVIDGGMPHQITRLSFSHSKTDFMVYCDQTGKCETVSKETFRRIRNVAEHADVPIVDRNRRDPTHLVLNMDVNKTVLMADTLTGKSQSIVLNSEIASAAWGTETNGSWVLRHPEVSARRPQNHEDLITYIDWLEQKFPGSHQKKFRQDMLGKFTNSGEPGAALVHHYERLHNALIRPDGSPIVLLPSFLHLLVTLKRSRRSFTVVFRTFGEDLPAVVEDLNAFCEGKHPMFPSTRLDGSDGEPDYRITREGLQNWGTFHRDDAAGLSVIMGTVEQPGEGVFKDVVDRTVGFYRGMRGVQIVTGFAAVQDFWWKKCLTRGTIAMRDYYQFWKSRGLTSEGGKVFFFDISPGMARHDLFFDDNIRHEDFYIIQPIPITDRRRRAPIDLLQSHVCRVEPIEAITNRNYFINQLEKLEEGLCKKLQSRALMKHLLTENTCRVAEVAQTATLHAAPAYDCWKQFRVADAEFAHRLEDACLESQSPNVRKVKSASFGLPRT